MGKIEKGCVGLTLLLLAACGPADPPERLSGAALAIAMGYPDSEDTAVVAIAHVPSGGLCSGSLIAPNLVLTARHCVSNVLGEGSVDCAATKVNKPFDAAGFMVTTADTVTPGSVGEHFVAQVLILPGTDPLLCGRDVAALVLEDAVPDANALPLEVRLDPPLAFGELYSAVGYGAIDGGGSDPGTRRRRDGLLVECVGGECEIPDVQPAEWMGTGGVCSGDSGGPALDDQGRVIGVTSRGEPDCGLAVYGSTVAFADWIRDAAVCAAGAGLYQPPAWSAGASAVREQCMPIGDACAIAADCATGRCLVDGSCTRPCSDDAPCPDDYLCEDRDGELVCVAPPPPAPPFAHAERDEGCTIGRAPRGGLGGLAWLLLLVMGMVVGRRRARCS